MKSKNVIRYIFAVSIFLAASVNAAAPYTWVEGESPTATNVPAKVEASAQPNWLSGARWLVYAIEPGDLGKAIGGDALELSYTFPAPAAGKNQVWARLGFDSARSPFQWRIDGGEWRDGPPAMMSTDLMEISFFCEISWLQLGDVDLAAGNHKLDFRVPKPKNAKGQPDRLMFALDALCITPGDFKPYSKFKPDEDHRVDADTAAAKMTFALPGTAPADGGRAAVALKGDWEICRADEAIPAEVATPMTELPPADVRWSSIAVPSDKGTVRPDLLFAHRVWYRTHLNVPAAYSGKSFFIEFPENSLNTTVVVNGRPCGFEKNPLARFQIDVSGAIKPGQSNELLVGIRDAWYGYARDATNPSAMRRNFLIPPRLFNAGFQKLVYPLSNHIQSGILETPTLIAAGGAYASDVFIKPSVSKKRLDVDVTINTPSGAVAGEIVCEAIDPKTQQVAKALPAAKFEVPAGQQKVVSISGEWTHPKLWWPEPDANLYTLRTTLKVNGQPADVSETSFGFREWDWSSRDFKLNGQVWHGWADVFSAPTADAWLAFYRKNSERFYRFWAPQKFFGMEDAAALDWFDRNGIIIRRTGVLDGEAMNYDGSIVDQLAVNWLDQEAAKIRGERNHPSIMIWSLENEISFINAINAGWIDKWEKVTAAMWTKVHTEIDPTRPAMVDGGGAGKANLLPVQGDHYVAGDPSQYPDLAYQTNPTGGARNAKAGYWKWDQTRPRFIGEDFFEAGNHPELSAIGGEVAFGGKAATREACSLMWSALQQGYRWANYGAWHFWLGQNNGDNSQYRFYAPRCALVKEWDWTFPAGGTVHRTVGLFNDSFTDEPLDFTWALNIDGKRIAGETKSYHVAAGTRQEIDLPLTMPSIAGRQEGELLLSLAAGGKEVYHDVKAVSVLNPIAAVNGSREGIYVYDPAGKLGAFLKQKGVASSAITDLKSLPKAARLLIVGSDAIEPADSSSTALAAYAAAGRSVLVLEQTNPLKYQAISADLEAATNDGQVGFPDNPDHPAMANLKAKDFFTWPGDGGSLFRNAYGKASRGATSLLQCGPSLQNTALAESPVGKGLMLLCQARVEEKLADSAVAQQLLLNLVDYGAGYKQTFRDVTVVAVDAPTLGRALDAIGLQYSKAGDPLAAIAKPGAIAVIHASPANLGKLAAHLPEVQAFTKGGGWLIFNGLSPEGLESYNKIVGVEHLMRPFKRERVVLNPVRDALLAGVTTSDITMYSAKSIFGFQGGNYVVSDEFSYVVDYDDIAPFCTSSFSAYDNIVNNFVSADGWPLIINFPVNKDGSPSEVPITLPPNQTLSEMTWIGNVLYWPQTKLNLVFDDNPATAMAFDVQPNAEPQVLKINPPRAASKLTLQIVGWEEMPGKNPLIGIDNIYLKAQRSPEFYEKVKPMLNIGGLVRYPQGSGGVVLCNLLLKDTEDVPANGMKKQNIVATILRNLKAPFAGGKTVIAGANLAYSSIDISKQANAYRNDKGWFDKKFTFADLPTGKQKFAGVDYDVYEFATSPVPTVVMLGGPTKLPEKLTGIRVNRKADALFFLQTARIDQALSADDVKKKVARELFHYIVHYADGKTETIPVNVDVDVANFKQEGAPRTLPGAQLAWSARFEGSTSSAVAYSKQWSNPRPDTEISSIDMAYGDPKRGVPVLLAITAASANGDAAK